MHTFTQRSSPLHRPLLLLFSLLFMLPGWASTTLYLQKPDNWSNATAHLFDALPSGSFNDSQWPGLAMAAIGNGWYRIDLADVDSAWVVFNDDGGAQSPDLPIGGENCYTYQWQDDCSQRPVSIGPLDANAFDRPIEGTELELGGDSGLMMRMHWVTPDTLVWNGFNNTGYQVRLYHSAEAELTITDEGVVGRGNYLALNAVSYNGTQCDPADENCRFGYLDGPAYRFNAYLDDADLRTLAKHQLLAVAYDAYGNLAHADRIQLPGAIDALFAEGQDGAYQEDLGLTFEGSQVHFRLWAPTAQSVDLKLYDSNETLLTTLPMAEDSRTGIWSVSAERSEVDRRLFRYDLRVFRPDTQAIHQYEVSDPYSVSLASNSRYSRVVDLTDADLAPTGWHLYQRPIIADTTDLVIYEAHVRDFSARDASTLNASPAGEDYRGKYRAFSLDQTTPMQHLNALADAGLNMVHLLPVNDLGSINADRSERVEVTDTVATFCAFLPGHWVCNQYPHGMSLLEVLASFDPYSDDAELVREAMRDLDGFNWGYDPYHFFAPESSYATQADGIRAIIELRELIQTLHQKGLTVALDVVYNHTFRAGLDEKSVLDKAVPGYYHRLDPYSGAIEDSTCCPNTATERRMMEKVMIDSLVLWAEHYRFDAFRFDLMGHIPLAAGLRAREAVQAIHPTNYFYGEGWNFGEVANNARFYQASQLNKAGTGIGTFSDRLREAVRQGTIFSQYDNHPLNVVRYGLAGNLRSYPLTIDGSAVIRGEDYLWNGNLTGYSLEPFETVSYVSKHDNPTLWDNFHETLPGYSNAERTAIQKVALSYPLLGQGIPFVHMGSELLRSKSMDRDSYDSGDWFNYVDFTRQTNNWHVGLPSCEKNSLACGGEDRYPMILDRIYTQPSGPTPQEIDRSFEWFQALLRIRNSSKLFRLPTAASIESRVRFHNTGSNPLPGLVVMSIDDGNHHPDLDPQHDALVVLFNAYHSAQSFTLGAATGQNFERHWAIEPGMTADQASVDNSTGTFTVPARSTAVFVLAQQGEQGPGLYGNQSGATVNFRCDNAYTNWGQGVYVVGSDAALGNWNSAEGIAMSPDNYPQWYLTLGDLPANTSLEWKCVIRSESDPNDPNAVWQGGANNQVTTGNSGTSVSSVGSF